jgi:hypothetical protein
MDLIDSKQIVQELSPHHTWKPKEIPLDLSHGLGGPVHTVDLVSIVEQIPQSTGGRKQYMQNTSNRYYLPGQFNRNDDKYRQSQIIPFIAQACAKVGIEIRSRGWQDVPQKLTLKCVRGRVYCCHQSQKNVQRKLARQGTSSSHSADTGSLCSRTYTKPFKERRSQTTRPKEKDMQCSFQIVLKWEPTDSVHGSWYIFSGNMTHEGHLQKTADEVQLYLMHHKEESTRLARNAMNIHLGCGSSTQLIVARHTDAFFTLSQLEALKRSRSDSNTIPEVPAININRTAAERLLTYLQCQTDISYCALFANIEIGHAFVSIRKKNGQNCPNQLKFRNLEMSSLHRNGSSNTEIINTANLVAPGETDTPQSHTERILGALTVGHEAGEKSCYSVLPGSQMNRDD